MTIPSVLTALESGETPWFYVDGTKATYMAIVNELNNNTGQITGVLSNYGTGTILDTFALFPTIETMHQYVQSVAMTGVDPTQIGSANDLVVINNTGDGFLGISQNTFLNTNTYLNIVKRSELVSRLIESTYFY
jgi:hypothetical protein